MLAGKHNRRSMAPPSKIGDFGTDRELSAMAPVIATATAGFMAESFLFFLNRAPGGCDDR